MNSVSLDGVKTLEDKLDDEQKVVLDELMKRLNKALPSSIHCRTTADVHKGTQRGSLDAFCMFVVKLYSFCFIARRHPYIESL